MSGSRNVVLVHGGFVDGSGWQAVYDLLKRDGFDVSIVQNPTLSLEGDVAATKQILDAQDGPAVLVGHSYGGAVITEAGNDDRRRRPRLHRRVRPRQGRVGQHADRRPAARSARPADPAAAATGSCSSTVTSSRRPSPATSPPTQAAFMADSQVPWGVGRARRHSHRAGVAHQAELVPGRHRRPDDPAARPAGDGRAGRRHGHRGPRQPLRLRVPARRRRSAHRPSSPRLAATSGGPPPWWGPSRRCVCEALGVSHAPFDQLRPASTSDHVQWAVEAMSDRRGVALVVPDGFDAYVRLLHPLESGERWAVQAPDYLAAGTDPYAYPFPDRVTAAEGDMGPALVDALVPALTAATSLPDDCHYGMWKGWGDLHPGSHSVLYARPSRRSPLDTFRSRRAIQRRGTGSATGRGAPLQLRQYLPGTAVVGRSQHAALRRADRRGVVHRDTLALRRHAQAARTSMVVAGRPGLVRGDGDRLPLDLRRLLLAARRSHPQRSHTRGRPHRPSALW